MKTILVLEDEPPLLKLLRHMLKQYKVLKQPLERRALQRPSSSDQPSGRRRDAANESGIVVALLLRFEVPDMPVILTSGYPEANWSPREQKGQDKQGHNLKSRAGSDGRGESKVQAHYSSQAREKMAGKGGSPHIVTIDPGDGDMAVCKLN